MNLSTLRWWLASGVLAVQTPASAEGSPHGSQEAAVLRALSTNRPQGQAAAGPVIDESGAAVFVYGASLPIVVCKPLQLCDIELQAGEVVQGVHVGDQARWALEAAVTGTGSSGVHHVIVSPLLTNIRTQLVITTDRRAYHIALLSDEQRFMPRVSFSYPGLAWTKWRDVAAAPMPAAVAPLASTAQRGSTQALSFGYELSGDDPPWKPVRVFNDGLQTMIDLPFAVRQTEAPVLLVVRTEAGVFSDDELVQVNYRVQGTRYVVDTVFDTAVLLAGVDGEQRQVRIRRIAPEVQR